jgi:sugar/nucleoside kinase (ribokinase family)
MVTFVPSRPGRLADVPSFARTIGGAESNVACALAAAGHAVPSAPATRSQPDSSPARSVACRSRHACGTAT